MRIDAPKNLQDYLLKSSKRKSKKVKKCMSIIKKTGGRIEMVSNDIIWANNYTISIGVFEKKKILSIAFHVDLYPGWAAVLALRLANFASENSMIIFISECYVFACNENDEITAMLSGKDAYDYIRREPILPDYIYNKI